MKTSNLTFKDIINSRKKTGWDVHISYMMGKKCRWKIRREESIRDM
jgi:hypothetical protein